ncbi:MAG: DUF992 domain-containing protein [Bauldia sp.]
MSGNAWKKSTLIVAAAALFQFATASAASAQERIKLGLLECNVAPSVGLIIGSSKAMDCRFTNTGNRVEFYGGSIDRLGIDIGFTTQQLVAWAVFAPVTVGYSPGALAGGYAGVSAEATLGLGLGANVLVGGFGRSFVLQPLSVQAQTGANIAAGVTGVTLVAR